VKNKLLIGCLLLCWSIGCLAQTRAERVRATRVRVILDADIDSDVDDVQALAMLHAYEKKGLIRLLGVVVTSNDSAAAACTDAINTFYGRPDLPIGYLKNQPNLRHFSKYTRAVAEAFPHSLTTLAQATESARLCRKLLADSPDGSVVIVTIGHLTSLQNLLQSGADEFSPLDGQALVAKKVKKWLCMGGQFPSGKEANFFRPDPQSTVYCLDHWTQEAVFCGWEVGNQIKTGGTYLREKLPATHPVYRAYELYNNFVGRPAWDQVAVLLLDEKQAKQSFELVRDGHVSVAPDGSNTWQTGAESGKNHAYVRIRAGVNPDTIARYMDDLVIALKPDNNPSK
jgi:inosine-uridine nucleoside N-ribohydrolase